MAQTNKKQGSRPKHVPQRTCIACRRSDTKRGLMRIVRASDGHVSFDPTGKQSGRGAYLCHEPVCWEQALKRNALARALRIEALTTEDREALAAIARSLTAAQEADMTN